MKIGIVCSSGGHLTEALSALDSFEGHDNDTFLIFQGFKHLKDFKPRNVDKVFSLPVFFGYSWHLGFWISMFWHSLAIFCILMKERPAVLFSTGAEIALPAFIFGKLFFRTRTIFLESVTRTKEPSLTGKWVYRWADLFLVQDASHIKNFGPKAVCKGSLI